MAPSSLGRRDFLFVAATASLIRPAYASQDDAAAFIRSLADQTIDVISDPTLDTANRIKLLRSIVDVAFDRKAISRFVLGRHWGSLSEDQQQEFIELFATYLTANYARRFENYNNEKLVVDGVSDYGDDKYLVRSKIRRSSGDTIVIDWRVRQTGGSWKVYDVVTEGVSLVLTRRSEMTTIVEQHGIEGLFERLRQHAKN